MLITTSRVVPWTEVVIDNDERFIVAEPEPMHVNQSESGMTSIWDDLWPGTDSQATWACTESLCHETGTWVAFDKPAIGNAQGRGMQMTRVGADRSEWSDTSEGFGVAVMHQLHCVVSHMKTGTCIDTDR